MTVSESAIALVHSVRDTTVLFVGDTIVDEYDYVVPLGKSPKEHVIAVEYLEREVFKGGVEAAANHLRTFCRLVDVCASKTITRKVRMVDKLYLRKLFEIHYQEVGLDGCNHGSGHDVVVITDFGHGGVTDSTIATWTRPGPHFLAVNAQTNSANIGFNLITKYPRADYIVIDEPEARLAAGDRLSSIEDVIVKLAQGRCDKFVVTLGSRGAIGYDKGVFTKSSALTQNIVDTLGAGDAFFSVTAPMARFGNMEDLLLIGNVAGALKTQIVGHRESVTKTLLLKALAGRHQWTCHDPCAGVDTYDLLGGLRPPS